MAEILIKISMGLLLLLCGVQDMVKKRIYLYIIFVGAIFIGACIPFTNTLSLIERIGGIAIGICVIMISLATRGKIGLGDGALLCVTGLGLGFWSNLELFAIGLVLAAVISIGLLSLRLADRKKSIPFVPFLLLGYVLLIYANASAG